MRNLLTQGVERLGVIGRNDIGFLLWDKTEERTAKWQLGSRLKTPTLPMWVTKVNDMYGVLFNPNRELMRSHHAENRYGIGSSPEQFQVFIAQPFRFQLYYYANAEFKKEERRETILTIDTRTKTGSKFLKYIDCMNLRHINCFQNFLSISASENYKRRC